jgi:DNA-binding MarR family transcriptional regulator
MTEQAAGEAARRRVLEALDRAGHVSQRRVAASVGLAASRVNRIIRRLQEEGRVTVVDSQVRPFAYQLTPAGRDHLQELSYGHYSTAVRRYREVEERIRRRLTRLRSEGVRRVVLYGAGELMEVAKPLAESLGLDVAGVVEDESPNSGPDASTGIPVYAPERVAELAPDAVVVTRFRAGELVRARLEAAGCPARIAAL